MELLGSSKQGVRILPYYYYSSVINLTGTEFLLKPAFLHGISGSLHLVLFLVLFVLWVWKKLIRDVHEEGLKQRVQKIRSLFHGQTLICCLGLSVFNLALSLVYYFYWYRNGSWSEEKIITLLDLALRTLAWVALSVYLHAKFFSSGKPKFPYLLRVWWAFYFSISCYCLVIHIVLQTKHVSLPIQSLVSDVVSAVTGLFFMYKYKGDATVTPFSSAGILSILTFSWVGSLIAVGNKKTLDLEDVPQLDPGDSVAGAFSTFQNKLELECGSTRRVTTLNLMKALIFTAWKEIIFTAFLILLYTGSCYVGPYLIDTFVQYLNGRMELKNEGYILVSIFFLAKIVECLSARQWFFMVQQIGVRIQAVLVAVIYNKGLTLSCQSKQEHTNGEIINFMTVDAERVGDFSWCMHDIWMAIVQIALALVILYKNLGFAAIAAFVATVLIMLLTAPLANLQENYQENLMESKDRRMKATSEILRNMRILKLQAWEMKFLSRIIELRKSEENWLKKLVNTSSMTTFVFWCAPTFVSVVTFGACAISMIAQTKVSLDRIASFLSLDDLQPNVIEKLPRGSSDLAIEIFDGTFSWDLSSPNATLKHINFRVSHGMKVAICVVLAQASRVCFRSGKIEENILFGKEMDREWYERVLEACSLNKDLEILSFGDQTVIGERGINLSGGQKQRIQIARALYQDADIYLFDDPFSAVDVHTGSHLFKECLLHLLSFKTVIYVTHQLEFLPAADLILVMKDGMITQSGKYNDLLNSGADFMELVGAHKKALSTINSLEARTVENISLYTKDICFTSTNEVMEKVENKYAQNNKTYGVVPEGQLVQEEEREKGRVGLSVYCKYLTLSNGGALVPCILLAQVCFQILQIGSNYWMVWATPISKDIEPVVGEATFILVYFALAIGSSFCILTRVTLLATAGYKTATLLFNKMHHCIFHAPMPFFDATPSGRILNRASTDQSEVDLNIPFQVGTFAFTFIQLVGIIAVMSQVAWQVFIVFMPVTAACIWYQQYYMPSARELARLVGVCKAPVIQHFAETISGSKTIRSFDQIARFQDTNMRLMDGFSRPRFHLAGIAGLAVTYGLNLSMTQSWLIWNLCNMNNKIISVERIFQYTSIPSEPPIVLESNQPHCCWPSHGEIEIRDLQALDKCQLGDDIRKKEGKLDSTGLIEEYDSPTRLLENKSSSFAQLVAEYSTRSGSNF
ncbi:hypothetical protein FEM48_Zijuj06G0176200 [Ziziphus jujuba var. spinosa]|uniref:ABC-type xenobiotic transporter n=1 Tax=Ziziphus jujuba var. spinosa TaxID=714518 RepID=A0A978VAP0_ZIZJJ|nr:hypothetical protein FEM48_Zijuj06G0176200 [Ziziphus jujuba var. spinosa]